MAALGYVSDQTPVLSELLSKAAPVPKGRRPSLKEAGPACRKEAYSWNMRQRLEVSIQGNLGRTPEALLHFQRTLVRRNPPLSPMGKAHTWGSTVKNLELYITGTLHSDAGNWVVR